MRSDWLRQTDTTTPNIVGLDFKTVSFFLKISKEIGKAWRKGLMLAKGASLTPCEARKKKSRSLFSASFQTFCVVWLLARTWIRKNKDSFAAVLQHCFSNKVGSCCVRSVCHSQEFDRFQTLRIAERLRRMHYQWNFLWQSASSRGEFSREFYRIWGVGGTPQSLRLVDQTDYESRQLSKIKTRLLPFKLLCKTQIRHQ